MIAERLRKKAEEEEARRKAEELPPPLPPPPPSPQGEPEVPVRYPFFNFVVTVHRAVFMSLVPYLLPYKFLCRDCSRKTHLHKWG